MPVEPSPPVAPFILVLAPMPTAIGGIERANRDFLGVLADRYGKDRVGLVQVWSGGPVADLDATVLRAGPARDDESSRIGLWNKASFLISALRGALRNRDRPLVVVSCHPFLAPIGWMCALLGRGSHVVWCYGVESWDLKSGPVATALRRARQVMAISSYTAERVAMTARVRRDRVAVVHLPVSEDVARAAAAAEHSSETPTILTVGRLHAFERRKGIDTVLQAMPKMLVAVPALRYVIVGDGGDRPRLESIARDLKLEEHVTFAGDVSDDELMDYYATSDVFVMPSDQEGFGLVFIEAMSFGVPVIGGNRGGTTDVIEEGVTGFLVPFGDEDAVVDRVVRLLSDPELRSRLGAAGRAAAGSRFSLGAFRREVLGLMDPLVNPIPGREPHDLLQERNKSWWTKSPMGYDWRATLSAETGTPEYFDEIDARFFDSSPLYNGVRPFDRLIPFEKLEGKRVLEVGCGLGAHAQLLVEAGCDLTAIDLTPTAIEMTKRRMELRGLSADIRRMDAETLEFPDAEFDFVWSWGVIHHSADPELILREIYRVLKPGGELRMMVYNRRSLYVWYCIARGIVTGKMFRGMSLDDMISHYTDGYIARSYSRQELTELLQTCRFGRVRTKVAGQTVEMFPLPGSGAIGRMKETIVAATPRAFSRFVLSRWGYFLVASSEKPTE